MSFGPNVRAIPDREPYFHHREPYYRSLLRETTDLFRQRFQISDEFDILIMTGSGTTVNEAVMRSLRGPVRVHGEYEFAGRLRAFRAGESQENPHHVAVVGYETARSLPLPSADYRGDLPGVFFADCVSSFPYYPPPQGVDVWTTVSSKQIGALPVLGIAVVRETMWPWFKDGGEYSYLNLWRWRAAKSLGESPHTPAIPLIEDLRWTLTQFDLQELVGKIRDRGRLLLDVFNPEDVIGEGPVLTVKPHAIPPVLASAWNLYRGAVGWQFFLYSGTYLEYEVFAHALTKART